jgi:hypothetical protein
VAEAIVRMDIWGGESSMDHVARMHFRLPAEAQSLARLTVSELRDGFLVNLRELTVADGPECGWAPFDERRAS